MGETQDKKRLRLFSRHLRESHRYRMGHWYMGHVSIVTKSAGTHMGRTNDELTLGRGLDFLQFVEVIRRWNEQRNIFISPQGSERRHADVLNSTLLLAQLNPR